MDNIKLSQKDYEDFSATAAKIAKLNDGPLKDKAIGILSEAAKSFDPPAQSEHPETVLGNLLGYGGGIVKTTVGESALEAKKALGGGGAGGRMQNVKNAFNPFSEGAPSLASYMERADIPAGPTIPIGDRNPSLRDIVGFVGDTALLGGTAALEKKYADALKYKDLLKYGENSSWTQKLSTALKNTGTNIGNTTKLAARAALNPLEEAGTQIKRLQLKNADMATKAAGAPSYSKTVLENNLEGWTPAGELQNVQNHINNSRSAIDSRLDAATQSVLDRGESTPTVPASQIYQPAIDDLTKLQQLPPYTIPATGAKDQIIKEVEAATAHRPGGPALLENRDINNAPLQEPNVIDDEIAAQKQANDSLESRQRHMQETLVNNRAAENAVIDAQRTAQANKIRARIAAHERSGFKPDQRDVSELAILESAAAKSSPEIPVLPKYTPQGPSREQLSMAEELRQNRLSPASILDMPEQPEFRAQDLRAISTGHQRAAADAGAYNVNRTTMGIDPSSIYAQKQAQIGRAARDAEQQLLEQMQPGAGAAASQNYADMNSLLSGAEYANKKFVPGTTIHNTNILPDQVPSNMGFVGKTAKELLNVSKGVSYPAAKAMRSPWSQLLVAPALNAATRRDPAPMTPEETLRYYLGEN